MNRLKLDVYQIYIIITKASKNARRSIIFPLGAVEGQRDERKMAMLSLGNPNGGCRILEEKRDNPTPETINCVN